MEFWKPTGGGLEGIVARLSSQDANDRVKAAAELGEVGTPNEAPELLKAAYEDEASTVRQMAIQAYAEILGEDSIDELVKAVNEHFDDYVRLYAIISLGNLPVSDIGKVLVKFLPLDDSKLRAATLRALIHSQSTEYGDPVFTLMKEEDDTLVFRNCIEALTLWRYAPAKSYLKGLQEQIGEFNTEIQTFISFYLASFGNKQAREFIENGNIDEFIRIQYDDQHFRGRKGILRLLDRL